MSQIPWADYNPLAKLRIINAELADLRQLRQKIAEKLEAKPGRRNLRKLEERTAKAEKRMADLLHQRAALPYPNGQDPDPDRNRWWSK
jgi:hypothetical protein